MKANFVALGALADIAGVDAVFGQRARAVRVVAQQALAIEVKIAHQRHIAAQIVQIVGESRPRRRQRPRRC